MSRSPRSAPVTVMVALVVLAVAGAACSIAADDVAVVVGPAPDVRDLAEPGADLDLTTPDEPALSDDGALLDEVDGFPDPPFTTDPTVDRVVLVDAAGELVAVTRTGRSAPSHALRALDALLEEPLTDAEREQGLQSWIPDGTRVVLWEPALGPGVVGVMLSPAFDAGGTDTVIEQRILQVVCTVGGAVGATEVELAVGESPESDHNRFIGRWDLARCPG